MDIRRGDKFGKLTVKTILQYKRHGMNKWLLKCDCGNEVVYHEPLFVNNQVSSCGCCDEEKSDMIGKRFGHLTVLKRAVNAPDGSLQWLTQCDCGSTRVVKSDYLQSEDPNCGCTHALTKNPLYSIWFDMKRRCYNPKTPCYKNYGARGIKVCDRWLESFQNFYDDMHEGYEKGLQLDRKDNNGPYSPENCRWATPSENQRNKRNNHLITTALGEKTLAEQAELTGVSRTIIQDRLTRGMPEELSIIPNSQKRNLKSKVLKQLCEGKEAVWMDNETSQTVNDVLTVAELQAKAIKSWSHHPDKIITGDREW